MSMTQGFAGVIGARLTHFKTAGLSGLCSMVNRDLEDFPRVLQKCVPILTVALPEMLKELKLTKKTDSVLGLLSCTL